MKANGPTGEEVGVGTEEGHLGRREGGRNGWMGATSKLDSGKDWSRKKAADYSYHNPLLLSSLPPSLLPYLLFLQVIQ